MPGPPRKRTYSWESRAFGRNGISRPAPIPAESDPNDTGSPVWTRPKFGSIQTRCDQLLELRLDVRVRRDAYKNRKEKKKGKRPQSDLHP